MNYEAFIDTLEKTESPSGLDPRLAALWCERKGDWDRAHRIVQELADRSAARVHAYLHRVEGDLGNSRYWHNRAGTGFPEHLSLEEEWRLLVEQLLEGGGKIPSDQA